MPLDDGVRPYGLNSLHTGASKYKVIVCSCVSIMYCIVLCQYLSASLSYLPLFASALGFPLSGISLNHQRFNESFYAPATKWGEAYSLFCLFVLVRTYVRPSHFVVMVLGNLPVPGRPTIWSIVGQGPTALAVGGGC